jgi:H+/gluconate symporter-like permease
MGRESGPWFASAGVNASALPAISVANLVGSGDAVLGRGGGLLVVLAVAINTLAARTDSASGGMTITLDAPGATFLERAAQVGMEPAPIYRVAVICAGTLDSLPHNGAVVTLLSVYSCTYGSSYRDVFTVATLGAIIALVLVVVLGSLVGSF